MAGEGCFRGTRSPAAAAIRGVPWRAWGRVEDALRASEPRAVRSDPEVFGIHVVLWRLASPGR